MNKTKLTTEQEDMLQDYNASIQRGEVLQRMLRDPGIREFLDYYLKDVPIKLTYSLSSLAIDEVSRDNILKSLHAVAFFKQYLDDVLAEAEIANQEKRNIIEEM